MAATAWRSNADLIVSMAALGYIKQTDKVLDPTYGRGNWWQKFRPERLVYHDKYTVDGVDFTDLPHDEGEFDVVAYDPPYVSKGGRETTTMPDFQDRYGMTRAPTSPAELQGLIDAGTSENFRVLRPGGVQLIKVQDYVSSGKLWLGTHWTLTHALALGFEVLDRMEHITSPRPQPPGRRQVHARRNFSTLLVLQKPKRRSVRP